MNSRERSGTAILFVLIALAGCATPINVGPARLADFRSKEYIAGLPVSGTDLVPVYHDFLDPAVADGRVKNVVWSWRQPENEIRLEGVRGGDLRTVRFLGCESAVAILVEPIFPESVPPTLARQAEHLEIKIGELAFVSSRLGLLYKTQEKDCYAVVAPSKPGMERSMIGLLWARVPEAFVRKTTGLVDFPELASRLRQAASVERTEQARDLEGLLEGVDCPEVESLIAELGTGLDKQLAAIQDRFSKLAAGNLLAEANLAAEAAGLALSTAGGVRKSVPARMASTVLDMTAQVAETCATKAAAATDELRLTEGLSYAAIAAALRSGPASGGGRELTRKEAAQLVSRLRGARLCAEIIEPWHEAPFVDRMALYAKLASARLGDPLPAVQKQLADSLAAQTLEQIEAAMHDERLATAAGLLLALHGLRGGEAVDAASDETTTLRAIIEREAVEGTDGPLVQARRHVALLLAKLLPVPDPATTEHMKALGSSFDGVGILADCPAARMTGITTGSLDDAAAFARKSGAALGKLEVDKQSGGEISCQIETLHVPVSWRVITTTDNSAEVREYPRRLEELRSQISKADESLSAVLPWISFRSVYSNPVLLGTYSASGELLKVRTEEVVPALARVEADKLSSRISNLRAALDELLRNPPPAVITNTELREGTYEVQRQLWTGNMSRRFRFQGEVGNAEWERTMPADGISAVRSDGHREGGVRAEDKWLSEAQVRERFQWNFDEQLPEGVKLMLVTLLADNAKAYADGCEKRIVAGAASQGDTPPQSREERNRQRRGRPRPGSTQPRDERRKALEDPWQVEAAWARCLFVTPPAPEDGKPREQSTLEQFLSAARVPLGDSGARLGWFGEVLPEHLRRGNEKPIYLWEVSSDLTIEMVRVPAGDFVMGSDVEARERPRHNHHMPQGFYIGRYETTWDEYRVFCKAKNRKEPDAPIWQPAGNHPVVNVSWSDAQRFCDWAGLALPTEAQWEKAARGEQGLAYPWGGEWDGSLCNHGKEPLFEPDESDGHKYTSPVDRHFAGASPYGALDMAGNVLEWCQDWYDEGAYLRYAEGDARAPAAGNKRVLRGGSWNTDSKETRSARRVDSEQETVMSSIGFRPVKNVED